MYNGSAKQKPDVLFKEAQKFCWRAFRIVRCDDVHLFAGLLNCVSISLYRLE